MRIEKNKLLNAVRQGARARRPGDGFTYDLYSLAFSPFLTFRILSRTDRHRETGEKLQQADDGSNTTVHIKERVRAPLGSGGPAAYIRSSSSQSFVVVARVRNKSPRIWPGGGVAVSRNG